MPLNNITKSFGHIISNNENQRVFLSAKTDNPLVWKVSKIENTKPIGIIKATLKETVFNPHTDYIEKDDSGNIIGMWADYNTSEFEPILPDELNVNENDKNYNHCHLYTSQYSIKNGGSYRTITSKYFRGTEELPNNDMSDDYSSTNREYMFEVDGEDVSEYVVFVEQENKNIFKVKFNNVKYIGKMLSIKTILNEMIGSIDLEII